MIEMYEALLNSQVLHSETSFHTIGILLTVQVFQRCGLYLVATVLDESYTLNISIKYVLIQLN